MNYKFYVPKPVKNKEIYYLCTIPKEEEVEEFIKESREIINNKGILEFCTPVANTIIVMGKKKEADKRLITKREYIIASRQMKEFGKIISGDYFNNLLKNILNGYSAILKENEKKEIDIEIIKVNEDAKLDVPEWAKYEPS